MRFADEPLYQFYAADISEVCFILKLGISQLILILIYLNVFNCFYRGQKVFLLVTLWKIVMVMKKLVQSQVDHQL